MKRVRATAAALAVCAVAVACLPSARGTGSAVPQPSTSRALRLAGLDTKLPRKLDRIIDSAIAAGVTPGAAIAVVRNGYVAHVRGHGYTDWDHATASQVDGSTLYDLASLTKVIATTTLAMMLEESGKLDIDRTVASYVPELDAPDKASITVRQILIHRGGLEAFAALYRDFRGREAYLEQINKRPLASPPGTRTVYSDWDMILLQFVIERITGQPLDVLSDEMIFRPLEMYDTRYSPPEPMFVCVAATEVDTMRGGLVRGFVHDENAWAMGGVAGHAGLFSTANDLARFAMMMLNGGSLYGVRLLAPETIARWTARQGRESSRALGWDTPVNGSSAGRYFSPRSFGHTGFTGTSIWFDPEKDLAVILLTNRVNPTRENNKIGALRRAVADAVQQSVKGARLRVWYGR